MTTKMISEKDAYKENAPQHCTDSSLLAGMRVEYESDCRSTKDGKEICKIVATQFTVGGKTFKVDGRKTRAELEEILQKQCSCNCVMHQKVEF